MKEVIVFKTPVDRRLKEDLEKKIYYISEDILDFALQEEGNYITGVRLSLEKKCNLARLAKYMDEIIERDILGLREIRTRRIWDQDDLNKGESRTILDSLITEKIIHIHGEGQVSIREPYLELYTFFDHLFLYISSHLFDGTQYRFPTLLKNSVLKKVGYFRSFPHLLMLVGRLKNTVENFNSFVKEFDNQDPEEFNERLLDYLIQTNYSLPPTMCYYVYDMFSNQNVSENICITARGKSFRYENKYQKPLQRLWDFTIRETVFLGDYEYVRGKVGQYRQKTLQVMGFLGLKGYCETANDPFFLLENTAERTNIQKMTGSKYELRLRLNPNETIAVASFNLHSQFFAKRFHLYNESKENFIYTGCIGVGLERLFFAFLSQYGLDKEKWPLTVQDYMERKQKSTLFMEELLTRILT